MEWESTIKTLTGDVTETVDSSWKDLIKHATTVERVQDLVKVLDYELNIAKKKLLNDYSEGADISVVEKGIKNAESAYRIARSEFDILYFTYEYFSEDKNAGSEGNAIPEGVGLEDAPHIHTELCHTLHHVSNISRNLRIVQSMPRGHAKSLYLSNIFPIHQIVFRKRRFILIVSETESMSRKFIEFISDSLKFNEKLREDFGVTLSNGSQEENKLYGDLRDNVEAFETANGVFVQSASTGKRLRGARYKQFRPDLVICDDLESGQNTNTPELREKNIDFFNKTLMPIGTPEDTAFVYMGTMVHRRGLLPHVLDRADFQAKNYSAIVKPPEETATMWNEFEDIYRNQDNLNRLEDAEAYYAENHEVMDADVVTLWANRFPYNMLMMEKVNIGNKAFASEFLNKPSDDEDAIFKPDSFVWFDDKDLFDAQGRKMVLEIYGFWDLAVGKNQKSDYNAIITLGKDRRTGVLYVLDAWAKKVPMHEAKRVALQKIEQYGHHTFGVETIQAQFEMYRQLQGDVTRAGLYKTRIKPVNPHTKKEIRIGQLEPIFENGAIRIKRHQRLLIEQLTEFQNGAEHDDLPDALASCVELAGGNRNRRTYTAKPSGM